eukprot:7142527-Pyramimonas_sp.AAC.1
MHAFSRMQAPLAHAGHRPARAAHACHGKLIADHASSWSVNRSYSLLLCRGRCLGQPSETTSPCWTRSPRTSLLAAVAEQPRTADIISLRVVRRRCPPRNAARMSSSHS